MHTIWLRSNKFSLNSNQLTASLYPKPTPTHIHTHHTSTHSSHPPKHPHLTPTHTPTHRHLLRQWSQHSASSTNHWAVLQEGWVGPTVEQPVGGFPIWPGVLHDHQSGCRGGPTGISLKGTVSPGPTLIPTLSTTSGVPRTSGTQHGHSHFRLTLWRSGAMWTESRAWADADCVD